MILEQPVYTVQGASGIAAGNDQVGPDCPEYIPLITEFIKINRAADPVEVFIVTENDFMVM